MIKKYSLVFLMLFCAITSGFGQNIIISQYIETNSGTTPKGIEIFNVSGVDIVFSPTNNLQVFQGTNGSSCVGIGVNITSGTLSADEVWVIGTSNLTTYASANGTGISGTTTYGFSFNGDDALQVRLGGIIEDVFGTCGSDPGSSWSGGGVSTANNNLEIINGTCSGDTDGWINPSVRFTQISNGSTMTGFGNTPASCSSSCNISSSGLNSVICNNNSTTVNASDDFLTFNLNPTGSNLGTNFSVSVSSGSITPTTGAYGVSTAFTLQNGSAGSGNITVTITDDIDGACNIIETISDPGSCSSSSCNIISSGLTAITCNDNSTNANISDDFITFNLNPTGSNLGTNFSVSVSSGSITPTTGVYGVSTAFTLQNGSAGSGNVNVTITDDADGTCNVIETITDPGSCSSSGGCASVFTDDFSGSLSQWSNTNDWTISGGELKHDLSGTESESYIYADIGSQSLSSGDYQWNFCMRNGGWDPSGGNDFTYYLISNSQDLQTNATGYAVGVNRVGTSDLLTLYEVNGGTHSAIITSTFNWGSNHDVCIKVTRNTAGLWELLYSVNGGSELSAGTVTDTSHTNGQYTGAFFDFSSSRAGQLWIDDINICGTLCSTPANPITFNSSLGCTGIDLTWDAPSCAEEVLIVARDGAAVTASPTGDGSAYTDNTVFGSGTAISPGQFDVYEGNGTTTTVTGLTNGSTYHFTIYSRVGSSWSTGVSTSLTASFSVNIVSSFSSSNNCGNIGLTWSLPTCYDEVLIVARANNPVATGSPTGNGSAYTADSNFAGSGSNLLSGKVVFKGTIPPETITGLADGVTYHFKIFTRIGTSWSTGVTSSATAVSSGGSGPTTFIPGDLVFVGFDSYIGGGNDRFSILNMVDIGIGTEFTMANLLYEYNAPAGVSTGRWYDCNDDFDEAGEPPYVTLQYNGCSDIPKGSVICIETNSFPAVVIGITVNGVDATANFTVLDDPTHSNDNIAGNISTSNPDAIWLMQGTFTDVNTEPDGPDTADANPDNFRTFSGVVLGGLQTKGNFQPFSAAGNAGGTRVSRIHPDIECVYLETGTTSSSRFYGFHSGSTSGTHYALLANITDVTTNWTIQSASSGQTSDDIAAICSSSYTITGSANVAGHWIGGVSTDWFDCKNWENFSVPKRDTNVTIDNASTTYCDIDHTSPNAPKYGYVADCQDLTISDEKLNIDSDDDILFVRNITIQGTGSLDMNHDGVGTPGSIIYLYEDWTNSIGVNAFDEGNGHVIFSGDPLDGPQVINNNVPTNTEEFYDVTLDNDFDTSTSNNLYAGGSLIVDPTNTVTVTDSRYVYINNNFTNNGTFNVLNNGSLVQGSDTGVNTGNINVERSASVDAQDYVYWSSPITGMNVNNVSPSSPTNRIYKWIPTFANTNGTFGNWIAAAGETMQEGLGYIIRVPDGQSSPAMPGDLNFTANFNNGVPHNGPINSPALQVTRGSIAGEDDQWNLIGNPYPSAIDAHTFLDLNSSVLDGFVNLWTHGNPPTSATDPFYYDFGSNYYESDYITYNVLGGSYGPGDILIASGQSFMVNMLDTAPSPSNIVFNNSMRNVGYDNSQFYKLQSSQKNKNLRNSEKHRIWLDLVSENQPSNRILLGYAENATQERDQMYDAISDNLNFYSLIGSEEFVIQGRQLPFSNNDIIKIGYKSALQGNYNIAISAVDGLFANDNQIIYLKDNLIGMYHNLNEQPYSFTSEAGTFNNRFEIVYRTNALSIDEFISNSNNLTIVELENNHIKFSIQSNNTTINAIELFDMSGKSIYKFKGANNNIEILNLPNLRASSYIAKITLSNNQVITKKVIKK